MIGLAEAEKKNKKIRLSIPLSADIYEKIEKDAEAVGVSTATYGAMIIGNHYRAQQISLDYTKENMMEAFRSVFESAFKAKGLDFDKAYNEGVEKSVEDTKQVVSELLKTNYEK